MGKRKKQQNTANLSIGFNWQMQLFSITFALHRSPTLAPSHSLSHCVLRFCAPFAPFTLQSFATNKNNNNQNKNV